MAKSIWAPEALKQQQKTIIPESACKRDIGVPSVTIILLQIRRQTASKFKILKNATVHAVSVDRTRDLQIFSLTLSQLSYPRRPKNIQQISVCSFIYTLHTLHDWKIFMYFSRQYLSNYPTICPIIGLSSDFFATRLSLF